jgi:hypothetical protein
MYVQYVDYSILCNLDVVLSFDWTLTIEEQNSKFKGTRQQNSAISNHASHQGNEMGSNLRK